MKQPSVEFPETLRMSNPDIERPRVSSWRKDIFTRQPFWRENVK